MENVWRMSTRRRKKRAQTAPKPAADAESPSHEELGWLGEQQDDEQQTGVAAAAAAGTVAVAEEEDEEDEEEDGDGTATGATMSHGRRRKSGRGSRHRASASSFSSGEGERDEDRVDLELERVREHSSSKPSTKKKKKKEKKHEAEEEAGARLLGVFRQRAAKPVMLLNWWGGAVEDSRDKIDAKRRRAKEDLKQMRNSFLVSDHFVAMVNDAFAECDLDGNGTVDVGELYAGILLLYHNLNRIPWGGRKPPPTRAHVMDVYAKYDFNGDGVLDSEEFLALCQDLSQGVALDVGKRVFLVLIVFPLLALPMKRGLESLALAAGLPGLHRAFVGFPDHLWTSAVVALMVTALPFVEQQMPALREMTWQYFSSVEDVRVFRRNRRMHLRAQKVQKGLRDSVRRPVEARDELD